jgi:hypothetical protein
LTLPLIARVEEKGLKKTRKKRKKGRPAPSRVLQKYRHPPLVPTNRWYPRPFIHFYAPVLFLALPLIGVETWEDLELSYACEYMDDPSAPLSRYGVPPGCQVLVAMSRHKRAAGRPDPASAYWN